MKKVYPCIPQFFCIKVGFKGYSFHGHVFTMPSYLALYYVLGGFVLYFLSCQMSHLVRKPTIFIGENKNADQLRGNREADQRLCFRYWDSTIPLLLKSEISSF